jgi:hypothetical protein
MTSKQVLVLRRCTAPNGLSSNLAWQSGWTRQVNRLKAMKLIRLRGGAWKITVVGKRVLNHQLGRPLTAPMYGEIL